MSVEATAGPAVPSPGAPELGPLDGLSTIAVDNPATGERITTVPVLGAAQLTELAARARRAQPEWDSLGFGGRGRFMRRAQ